VPRKTDASAAAAEHRRSSTRSMLMVRVMSTTDESFAAATINVGAYLRDDGGVDN